MLHMLDKIREFADSFYQTYYQKDLQPFMDMMVEQAIWSSCYMENAIIGKDEIFNILDHLKQHASIKCIYQINDSQHDVFHFASDFYIVITKYRLSYLTDEDQIVCKSMTGTLLIHGNDELKVVEISIPLYNDEFIKMITSDMSSDSDYMDTQKMRLEMHKHAKQLEAYNRDMQNLYNLVPGGIFKCYYNETLTLSDMSDGFLSMIGYTRDEVRDDLNNSLINLIEPNDFIRVRKEVEEQLKSSNAKEIQYHLIRKDGEMIYVIDKGQLLETEEGKPCFYCIVVDITREKQIEEELHLSLERYQIIMNQTNDIVFEWDLMNDAVMVSNNWEKKFKNDFWMESHDFLAIINDHSHSPLHPEDRSIMLNCMKEIQEGTTYLEKEVRICDVRNEYLWCRIRMTVQFDDQHHPIKVIGVIVDIDQEKRRSLSLLQKAEQDALTGMYNKITTQQLIQNYLEENAEVVSALMIIDVDNFKQINDSKGHLYGDAVLSDLSRAIRKSFREDDIIGRIGGDEFMVFLKNIKYTSDVEKSANKMIDLMQHLQVTIENQCEISCSIGIAMYPSNGGDLQTLYQNADYALYQAKIEGKKRVAFYNEEEMHQYLINQNMPYATTINSQIDSNHNSRIKAGLFEEYVFQILYHSENLNKAISTILEIVGMQFDVSRVYIFENSEDNLYCSNTYEWCNEGVKSQKDQLQNLSYAVDLGGNYLENFNEQWIFYCLDIYDLPKEQYKKLAPQDIKSLLQCAVTDNGVFRGYVGFDECRQNRYWTQEQVNALVFISEIISTFLLKRRAEEQLRLETEGLMSILDNQSSWMYVLDPDTMKLLYANKKTMQEVSDITLGKYCYEVFMDNSTMCHQCPIRHLNEHCTNHTIQFYNRHFNVWWDAEATYITWKGKRAVLLTCRDISKYKTS